MMGARSGCSCSRGRGGCWSRRLSRSSCLLRGRVARAASGARPVQASCASSSQRKQRMIGMRVCSSKGRSLPPRSGGRARRLLLVSQLRGLTVSRRSSSNRRLSSRGSRGASSPNFRRLLAQQHWQGLSSRPPARQLRTPQPACWQRCTGALSASGQLSASSLPRQRQRQCPRHQQQHSRMRQQRRRDSRSNSRRNSRRRRSSRRRSSRSSRPRSFLPSWPV